MTTTEATDSARSAWTIFEPIHAVVYFAPEAREHFDRAGLKGGWMGYFASRSAPMGAVLSAVVVATFHNFQPAMVRRAIPDAWRLSTPERVLEARLAAVDSVLRRLWGDDVDSPKVAEAASLAMSLTDGLDPAGRPLFAAHQALEPPRSPHLALWHACTLLREHRFDGHVAALTGYGVGGLESLITAAALTGADPAMVRRFRGWTEEDWDAERDHLQARGLLDGDGGLTENGRELRAAVERITDRLAAAPWERVDATARERLLSLLRPLALRLEAPGGLLYPNPIGVPRPV